MANWTNDLDGGLRRLFEDHPDGVARGMGSRLLVFGNEALRKIAADPAAGNMPADVLNASAFNITRDGAPVDEEQPIAAALARITSNQVFTTNPPIHGPVRQLFARQLFPKQLQRFRPLIEETVRNLVEEAFNREVLDFGHEFTERVTSRFWAELLGLTAAEERRVVDLIRSLSPMFYMVRTEEETISADAAAAEYVELISAAVHRSLAGGDHPLLAEMAADFAELGSEGRPENLGVMLASNLTDGFHTAALAAANAVYYLLRQPEAFAKVKADPSLVPNAFFEGVRLAPPVILTQRFALQDFEYEGLLVPAGTPLVMLWIAGNRDPKVFPDPDRYDLSRLPRGDMTFGGGGHLCPGRNVARVLTEAVLAAVTASDVAIELVGHDWAWTPRSTMRQLRSMPVRISRLEKAA